MVTIAAMLSVGTIWAVPPEAHHGTHTPTHAHKDKKGGETTTALFLAARAALSHPFGDMHTYLHVYNTYVGEGRSQDWCERHYLHYWALVAADRMRYVLVINVRVIRGFVPFGDCVRSYSLTSTTIA